MIHINEPVLRIATDAQQWVMNILFLIPTCQGSAVCEAFSFHIYWENAWEVSYHGHGTMFFNDQLDLQSSHHLSPPFECTLRFRLLSIVIHNTDALFCAHQIIIHRKIEFQKNLLFTVKMLLEFKVAK